jgi:glycosyltransferase involved in cell wall biosynthesis
MRLPRISIVTASYNQGAFIARTIESLLEQGYSELEHIVIDGMSTDETGQVLSRYRHLRVVREPDRGQADAINKGMRLATGDILGFLNADDTLLPGALHRVAREIDPRRGRHVVMGRCRFIDTEDNFLGIEHPSAFTSHRRVLAIWKGHCIPQPAVFWTPEVWQRCGPLDEAEHLYLDYDLFCRFSKCYRFHAIDEPLATYRLHPQSKTSSVTDAERLAGSVRVSRRYWGSPLSPHYWLLHGSYGLYRLDRRRRAANLARGGVGTWRAGRRVGGAARLFAAAALAPDLLADWFLAVAPPARMGRLLRPLARLPGLLGLRRPHPSTLAWRDFFSLHADGWAGPTLIQTVVVGPGHDHLRLRGVAAPFPRWRPATLEVFLDGRSLGRGRLWRAKEFEFVFPLGGAAPGRREVKVVTSGAAVGHDRFHNGDFRPLSFLPREIAPCPHPGARRPAGRGAAA